MFATFCRLSDLAHAHLHTHTHTIRRQRESNSDRRLGSAPLCPLSHTPHSLFAGLPIQSGSAALLDTHEKRVVEWKFSELDANKDNVLRRKEVREMRAHMLRTRVRTGRVRSMPCALDPCSPGLWPSDLTLWSDKFLC